MFEWDSTVFIRDLVKGESEKLLHRSGGRSRNHCCLATVQEETDLKGRYQKLAFQSRCIVLEQ